MGIISKVKSFFSKQEKEASQQTTAATQTFTGGMSTPEGPRISTLTLSDGRVTSQTTSAPLSTTPSLATSGGGGGFVSPSTPVASTPQGTLLASGEIVPQSIPPSQIQAGQLSPQQLAAVRKQQRIQQQDGFSGRVVQSLDGTDERTRFFVEGRQVAESRAGEDFFRPGLTGGETATIEISRPDGTTQLIQVTPQELREREFEMRQESAQNLLFGGGVASASTEEEGIAIDERTGKPFGFVEPVEKPEGVLEGILFDIEGRRSRLQTLRGRDEDVPISLRAEVFAGGLVSPFIGTALGVKQFFTSPKETITAIPGGLKRTGQFVTSGELSRVLRQEPEKVTGTIIGGALFFKGIGKIPRGVVKVTDIGRGIGKTKISTEGVVLVKF